MTGRVNFSDESKRIGQIVEIKFVNVYKLIK